MLRAMSNSAKGLSSCLNGDHPALALQGEHYGAYTHTATKVKLSKRNKVGSMLSLLSAYCGNYRSPQPPVCVEEEETHHTGSEQRAVLEKCLPAHNKCLYKKHLKKEKIWRYSQSSLLISQDQQFRGFLGTRVLWDHCVPTQAMAPCTQMRHFLIHTTWQGFPCPASSQTSNTLQLCREKPKKCLSWCQLRAIDANGLVLLYTSQWSPSFPFLPSQQIFWCSIYKISIKNLDLVQQVLWHWFMSVTGRC